MSIKAVHRTEERRVGVNHTRLLPLALENYITHLDNAPHLAQPYSSFLSSPLDVG